VPTAAVIAEIGAVADRAAAQRHHKYLAAGVMQRDALAASPKEIADFLDLPRGAEIADIGLGIKSASRLKSA
jgi:hypothetical protein